MAPEDARFAARRAFGGVDQVKAVYREQRGLPSVDALLQDVRFGVRMLSRDRQFTVVAALALALGMGATTAVFTIVNGMNLRDLPFDEPDEIVALSMTDARGRRQAVSYDQRALGSLWQPQPVVLVGSAVFVLLVGCANAASLLLARSARRAREIALRAALGASRGRLVRQLLVESVLLAAVASLVGPGLSRFGVHLFRTETTNFGMPYWTTYPIDLHVFGFLAAACFASAILFGLAPAWHLSKTRAHDVLKERGTTGAGLLLRSAQALHGVDQVVDATEVITMQLTLPMQQYATADSRRAFYDRLEARLSALPEVLSATIAGARPFAPHGAVPRQVARVGEALPSAGELLTALTVAIGPRYFETLGVSLVPRASPISPCVVAAPARRATRLSRLLRSGKSRGSRVG